MDLANVVKLPTNFLTAISRMPPKQQIWALLVLGKPRTGKFWGIRPQYRDWANRGEGSLAAYLPIKNENAPLMLQDFDADGHGSRIEFDSLDDPNHCLPCIGRPKSTHADPYVRAMEDTDSRDRMIELYGRG